MLHGNKLRTHHCQKMPQEDLLGLTGTLRRTREPGALLKHIYEKRVACYKKGELLLDAEFDTMREGIREQNRALEAMIFDS